MILRTEGIPGLWQFLVNQTALKERPNFRPSEKKTVKYKTSLFRHWQSDFQWHCQWYLLQSLSVCSFRSHVQKLGSAQCSCQSCWSHNLVFKLDICPSQNFSKWHKNLLTKDCYTLAIKHIRCEFFVNTKIKNSNQV